MFKLKLINKPKMMKLKCNFTFPNVVLANLQEKEATPTKEMQQIIADQQYDGLSKVTVNPIPDEYIIPSGEIEINANGTYDVADKASAKVNIKEKVLGTKTITKNGTYKASDDDLDGYSEVEVETSGVDINDYYLTSGSYGDIRKYIKTIPLIDTSNVTSMYSMFYNCENLISIPQLNTSNVTNTNNMFYNCTNLTTIPQLDTSNVTAISYMFRGCTNLTTISQLNGEKIKNISDAFYSCNSLENFNGIINLGQAYLTTQSANYSNYTLNLSYSTLLTEQSIINILNNLYDIATKGCNAQQVILGATNLAKLTSTEGQQALSSATEKGWTLS